MPLIVEGVGIPDSKLAREITEQVRDTEAPLSSITPAASTISGRWRSRHRGLTSIPATLCQRHSTTWATPSTAAPTAFEVDGADAARDFLHGHGISEAEIDCLDGTPFTRRPDSCSHPAVAPYRGVEMNVLGLAYRIQRPRA
jgi:hypothetical protein